MYYITARAFNLSSAFSPVKYPKEVEGKVFPLVHRLLARLGFPVKVYVDEEGFKRPTDIYLAYCKEHRIYFLDYLHGFSGYLLCPRCLREERKAS